MSTGFFTLASGGRYERSVSIVVGDSVDEAKEKRALLDSRVHYDSAIASLSVILGTDASGFDPDGPLPEIPETNASKSGRQRMVDLAAKVIGMGA